MVSPKAQDQIPESSLTYQGEDTPSRPARERGRLATLISPGAPVLKKPNDTIANIRVIGDNTLGYLHKKVWNVMQYIAQHQKVPGSVLPPFDIIEPKHREYYWATQRDYCKGVHYGSKDLETFRTIVEDLQDFRLVVDSPDRWVSESLVAGVVIVVVKQQYWIGVALAPEVRATILRPESYTRISLDIHAKLRSGSALSLYEHCKRYLTNKIPFTDRRDWSDWYYQLSGKPITSKLPEYKYWKRDCLKRIIAEINTNTDIRIALHEYPEGRKRIDELQFEVHPNEQESFNWPPAAPIDAAILERIMALGVPQKEAMDILGRYDEGLLLANLAITEQTKAQGRITTSPRKFLVGALKENWAGNHATAKATSSSRQAKQLAHQDATEKLNDRFSVVRAQEALRIFAEMTPQQQADLQARFSNSPAALAVATFVNRGNTQAPAYRSAFGRWMARDTLGEPKPEEILAFAASEIDKAQRT